MAQKKNQDRKQQLQKFKSKIKERMSEEQLQQELAEVPQISGFPVWKSQEKLEISGLEWEKIYNLINIFREAVVAGESVMQRNTELGKITTRYVDKAGVEVTEEKVKEVQKQIQDIISKRQSTPDQEKAPSKLKIVSETGEGIDSAAIQPAPKNELTAV